MAKNDFDLDDVLTLEGDDADEEDVAIAMQKAINSGSAWSFQGSYGRSMMAALESGNAMLGKEPARDYYGNYIPSRDQVKAGTKGSYQLVADKHGVEYADMLAAL